MNNPIGIVANHIGAATLEEAFERAQSWQMTNIEWFEYDKPGPTEVDSAATIVRLSSRYGFSASYHAPWGGRYDLGRSADSAAAAAILEELIERASRLQATLMTVHLGRGGTAPREALLEKIGQALEAAAPLALRRGVVLCLENFTRLFSGDDLGDCLEDFEVLLDRTPPQAVGLNLDVGHAHMTRNMRELVALAGPRLRNTHLHDNDGHADQHRPFGAGTLDWKGLLELLKAADYAGPLNYEFAPAGDSFARLTGLIRGA
jgi:sugar phosphate isomerase/epimerase